MTAPLEYPVVAQELPRDYGRATFRRLFGRRHFARNVAVLSLGTALAQAFSIAVAPVITRLYTPRNLAHLVIFTSFLNVASVAASLKFELGIISAADEFEAAQLSYASVWLTVPVTLVSVTCLYAAMRLRWFGLGDLPWYAPPLMVPALLLTGIFAALRYWFIRKEQFQIVSRTYVGQHGARALSQVLFGLLGSTSAGLLAGEILGRVVGMTALYRKAWPSIREQIARLSMRKIVATLKHHRKLAVYSMPSSLIDTLAANITVPLLVQLYGTHMGGEFALVQRVLAVPLALISSSVAEAFHSRLAVCVRQDNGELKSLFWRTSAALLLIGAAPTAVLLLFGPTLFALVFGQGWHLAGVLAAIYAPWFLAQFVVSPLSRLVFVLRGQEEKLIYDVLLLLSIFLVYAVALHQHLTVIQTVWALMLVNTFAYVVYYCVLVWVLMTHPLSRDVMD